MKKISLLFLIIIFGACTKKFDDNDFKKLNGYWEIEKAVNQDGRVKKYKINQVVDYFFIKNKSGFRQKVVPQFNGKYLTNNMEEEVKILNQDGTFFLFYKTPFSSWKEQIIKISDNQLIFKSDQKTTYYYKKQIPYNIE